MPITNKWQETEDAIVNSIVSGNNACGTLQKAIADGPEALAAFLRNMVRPALMVRAQEEAQRDHDMAGVSRDNEAKRFALEFIAQNLGGSVQIAEPAIVDAVRKALPGRRI